MYSANRNQRNRRKQKRKKKKKEKLIYMYLFNIPNHVDHKQMALVAKILIQMMTTIHSLHHQL
jgi:hypothetical protein